MYRGVSLGVDMEDAAHRSIRACCERLRDLLGAGIVLCDLFAFADV